MSAAKPSFDPAKAHEIPEIVFNLKKPPTFEAVQGYLPKPLRVKFRLQMGVYNPDNLDEEGQMISGVWLTEIKQNWGMCKTIVRDVLNVILTEAYPAAMAVAVPAPVSAPVAAPKPIAASMPVAAPMPVAAVENIYLSDDWTALPVWRLLWDQFSTYFMRTDPVFFERFVTLALEQEGGFFGKTLTDLQSIWDICMPEKHLIPTLKKLFDEARKNYPMTPEVYFGSWEEIAIRDLNWNFFQDCLSRQCPKLLVVFLDVVMKSAEYYFGSSPAEVGVCWDEVLKSRKPVLEGAFRTAERLYRQQEAEKIVAAAPSSKSAGELESLHDLVPSRPESGSQAWACIEWGKVSSAIKDRKLKRQFMALFQTVSGEASFDASVWNKFLESNKLSGGSFESTLELLDMLYQEAKFLLKDPTTASMVSTPVSVEVVRTPVREKTKGAVAQTVAQTVPRATPTKEITRANALSYLGRGLSRHLDKLNKMIEFLLAAQASPTPIIFNPSMLEDFKAAVKFFCSPELKLIDYSRSIVFRDLAVTYCFVQEYLGTETGLVFDLLRERIETIRQRFYLIAKPELEHRQRILGPRGYTEPYRESTDVLNLFVISFTEGLMGGFGLDREQRKLLKPANTGDSSCISSYWGPVRDKLFEAGFSTYQEALVDGFWCDFYAVNHTTGVHFVMESDGGKYHQDPERKLRDKARDIALRNRGVPTFRVTHEGAKGFTKTVDVLLLEIGNSENLTLSLGAKKILTGDVSQAVACAATATPLADLLRQPTRPPLDMADLEVFPCLGAGGPTPAAHRK